MKMNYTQAERERLDVISRKLCACVSVRTNVSVSASRAIKTALGEKEGVKHGGNISDLLIAIDYQFHTLREERNNIDLSAKQRSPNHE
jgi:hypothetical protein